MPKSSNKKAQEEIKKKFQEIETKLEEQEKKISVFEKLLLEVTRELRVILEEDLKESGSKLDSLLEPERSLSSEITEERENPLHT